MEQTLTINDLFLIGDKKGIKLLEEYELVAKESLNLFDDISQKLINNENFWRMFLVFKFDTPEIKEFTSKLYYTFTNCKFNIFDYDLNPIDPLTSKSIPFDEIYENGNGFCFNKNNKKKVSDEELIKYLMTNEKVIIINNNIEFNFFEKIKNITKSVLVYFGIKSKKDLLFFAVKITCIYISIMFLEQTIKSYGIDKLNPKLFTLLYKNHLKYNGVTYFYELLINKSNFDFSFNSGSIVSDISSFSDIKKLFTNKRFYNINGNLLEYLKQILDVIMKSYLFTTSISTLFSFYL
jgi:hypothetical protein